MKLYTYDESYLPMVQRNLAAMMDFAVSALHYEPDRFFEMFIESGLAAEFENGNPQYLKDKSGAELAFETVAKSGAEEPGEAPMLRLTTTPVYWCGTMLAYYQWYTGKSFEEIHKILSFKVLNELHSTLKSSTEKEFVEAVEEMGLMPRMRPITNLRRLRQKSGYSQKRLSDASGVALRMIQLYEQRQNDINKAQGLTLYALSKALHCTIEELLEM